MWNKMRFLALQKKFFWGLRPQAPPLLTDVAGNISTLPVSDILFDQMALTLTIGNRNLLNPNHTMKNNLRLFLVVLLHATAVSAQIPGDHQFQFAMHNDLIGWTPGQDGAYFAWGITTEQASLSQPFVVKWDAVKDSILWNKIVEMPINEVTASAALLPAPDGGVYVGAVIDGCDYPTQEGLVRLDAAGNVLWSAKTPDEFRFNNRVWLFFAGNNVVFQTEEYRFDYSPGGVLLSIQHSPFPWNGLSPNSAGGYLAYGNGMIGSSSPFVVLPFPDDIQDAAQTPAGEWLLLGQGSLYRLNPALDILRQTTVTVTGAGAKVFWADEYCWITIPKNNTASTLLKIDPQTLALLDTFVYDGQYDVLSVLDAPGSAGGVWLSGNCNFPRNQTVFLHATTADNPVIAPSRSVAITGIRLEQPPYVTVFPFSCPPTGSKLASIYYGKAFVTVTNTGNSPVSRFRINARFNNCWNICFSIQELSDVFPVSLLPGESKEVLLREHLLVPEIYFSGTTHQLCLWTSTPDDGLDILPDDDRYCQTFSVTVSEKTPESASNTVRVAPNPANDQVTVFLDMPGIEGTQFHFTLIDLLGAPVVQTTFTGPGCTVSVGDLPAGTYFYRLNSREGVVGVGRLAVSR
jgi:hypothetical protein